MPKRPPPPPKRASLKPKVIAAIALTLGAALICAVYWSTLHSPFIFDDAVSVVKNRSIRHLWPPFGDAADPGPLNPPTDLPVSGRPLVNLSLALNYSFGRVDPLGYHVFNLTVHLLSALLLMLIVNDTLRLDFFEKRFETTSAPLAFVVALLWAIHPLQTETVVYVTQRTELMVGFFYLATLYGSLRYFEAISNRSRALWLVLSTLACLGGMASKEVMVSAPVLVLLFDRTFVAGSFLNALKKSWPLYVGLSLGWLLLLALNISNPRAQSAGFHLGIDRFTWWFTQAKVLLMYLKLAFLPWPLSIHYEMTYLDTLDAAWPWLLAVAVLVAVALFLFWRRTAVGFVAAWILLILSPTLIVPIATEVAAERRMYLPLAALLALVVVGAFRLLQLTRTRFFANSSQRNPQPNDQPIYVAGSILVVILVVAMCLASTRRLAAYQNDLTLWQDCVQSQPDDYIAYNNLGDAFHEVGRTADAVACYQHALQLNPHYYPAHNNMGAILNEANHPELAIPHFQEALRQMPNLAEAHNNLGLALANTGHLTEAVQQYNIALQLEPDYADAHFNLSLALVQMNRPQEAVQQCQLSLEFKPDGAKTWANLAMAYSQLNQHNAAVAAAEKSLQLARAQGNAPLATQVSTWLNNYRNR